MDSSPLQTPSIKTSEFVDRATEIIDRIYEQIDKCSPSCQALLKSKNGLVNETNTKTTIQPVLEPPRNDQQ